MIIFITAKIVISLFNEKNRHKAVTLLKIFSFLFLTIIFDIVNHLVLKLSAMPYFTMFGWQTSIIGFILLMVMRHAKINKENEYLASNLQREVALKTADLEIANNELLKETKKSPMWVHFGIGNIFRVFLGGVADSLLEAGVVDKGMFT